MKLAVLLLFVVLFNVCCYGKDFPVPLPAGGRSAVHGWLILPIDSNLPDANNPAAPVHAWFSHHVPEFWTTSPHDFQIIVRGYLVPMSVVENQTLPLDLPYPPAADLLVNEYSFTPPPPFSLNDLLIGKITQLIGVFYNGSFDTPYEREADGIATLYITDLTTATYLNESSDVPKYQFLRYLSYPRNEKANSGVQHYYFAHEIHAEPDFDHVVHGVIDLDSCVCKNCDKSAMIEAIQAGGAEWSFNNIPNDLAHKLEANQYEVGQLLSTKLNDVFCKIHIVERLHCMIGPGFDENC